MTFQHKWECSFCFGLHDSEEDAMDCCVPVLREVYECECGEVYMTEEAAAYCCTGDPE